MNFEYIKNHWENAGNEFPTASKVTPTSRDPYLALLERENILSYLRKSYTALEIGCGDGCHTTHYAKRVQRLFGIDISESLIKIATSRAESESIENVSFIVGSALEIKKVYDNQQFNCIVSQRCLINLPEWQYQQDVILQVYSLLQKDGIFLLTEGFQNELDNLNSVRQKFDLSEIKVVRYNRNLVRKDFEAFITKYFDIVEIRHYGLYTILSRVFHPLAVIPEEPKHDSKLNRVAMELSWVFNPQDFEKFSYNLFYVLKKK